MNGIGLTLPSVVLSALCGACTSISQPPAPTPSASTSWTRPAGEDVAASTSDGPAAFTPTAEYVETTRDGWRVLVNPELRAAPDDLETRVLALLDHHLFAITRRVPPAALDRLQEVPIWVEREMPKTACMCYHVSAGWLGPNGYNPEKEGAIEVGNAEAFLSWTKDQPSMVLHELAHAYHHRVLGVEEPRLLAAFAAATEQGNYDSVLHIRGETRRHYALTNVEEYFAEATEAYFGTNDFYPFVRAELARHDPGLAALLGELWDAPVATPSATP